MGMGGGGGWVGWGLTINLIRQSISQFVIPLKPYFNGLGKDNCKLRQDAFKFWDLLEYASGVHQEANEQTQRLHKYFDVLFHSTIITFNIRWSCWGYIGFTSSVRLSVSLSICPASLVHSAAPTVLVGSISYIYILSNNFWRCVMYQVSRKLSKFEFFGNFFNMCNLLDFVLFWLGIWCQSLVWVIMGRRGISECRRTSCSSFVLFWIQICLYNFVHG